jgi:hypothetical protein
MWGLEAARPYANKPHRRHGEIKLELVDKFPAMFNEAAGWLRARVQS